MLKIKQNAPEFSGHNQDSRLISLSDYIGKNNVVLYFYPKDDTPGCTVEANQFTALVEEFAKFDTVIIGVSKDSSASHKDFVSKYGLKIPLLADIDGEICNAYGVWQEKEKDGVKKEGIVRSTFIINKEGALVDVEYGVTPQGHAEQVLEKVRNL